MSAIFMILNWDAKNICECEYLHELVALSPPGKRVQYYACHLSFLNYDFKLSMLRNVQLKLSMLRKMPILKGLFYLNMY